MSLPASPFDGTVFLSILVQFLVRKGGVARKRPFRSFQANRLPQFLVAEVRGILVGHALLGECLVGYSKRELSAFRFRIGDAV